MIYIPPVVRLGDLCTGHGDFPPRPNISASDNVFVNKLGAHRNSDSWDVHCNPTPVCHMGATSGGSGSVFVNGKRLARVGDAVDCGSSCAAGSPDVYAGD